MERLFRPCEAGAVRRNVNTSCSRPPLSIFPWIRISTHSIYAGGLSSVSSILRQKELYPYILPVADSHSLSSPITPNDAPREPHPFLSPSLTYPRSNRFPSPPTEPSPYACKPARYLPTTNSKQQLTRHSCIESPVATFGAVLYTALFSFLCQPRCRVRGCVLQSNCSSWSEGKGV